MNNLIKIIILISMLGLVSCFKQDTPELQSDQTRTARDLDQLKACSGITFYEGFLFRQNLVNLFVCTSWDRKFVEMFKALDETEDQHWNELVRPIDSIFFGDRERRDRFINYYKDLDDDNALDDLGRVITSLTDTNFYDGLNALFVCAENPESSICKNRELIVSKDEIKNLLLLLNRDPKILLRLSEVIDSFHSSLAGDSEELRREIVKFNGTTFFKDLRVMAVSTFARKYLKGLSDKDTSFIRKVLAVKEPVSDSNWVNQWIRREDVSSKYLLDIVSLPVNEQPQLTRDLKVLNILYNEDVKCSNSDLELSVDIKSLVDNTVKYLKDDDIVKFFDTLIMASESISYARPICPTLTDADRVINYLEYTQRRNINHKIDLSNILKYSISLMAKIPTVDLMKFILEIVEYDTNYLMSIVNEDIFGVSTEINRVIVENALEFYPTGLKILKRSEDNLYYSLAYILQDIFKDNQSVDIKAWVSSWLFWNKEEQNFLFNFIDTHLESDTNYVRLFSFYSLFLKELSSDWGKIGEYYNRDEESKERTYQSMKIVLSRFHGKEILEDYKKFFSRDHILDLLKVITSGEGVKGGALSKLTIRNSDDFSGVKYPEIGLVNQDEGRYTKIVECAEEISERNLLVDLIRNYPQSCKDLDSRYALDNISEGISLMLEEFESSYPNVDPNHFFEIGGLLSPELSMWSIASVLSLNTELVKQDKNIESIFTVMEKYLLSIGEGNSRAVSIMRDVLRLSLDWLGDSKDIDLRNGVLRELVRNKNRVDVLYNKLPDYLDEFELWNKNYVENKYAEDKKYNCKEFLNIHVGKHICPDEEKVKSNINLLAERMVMRHEESEGIPIEYVLKAALPDGGVKIPLDGDKTKNKRLTLLETFNYLYDLSDKSLKVNREKVKYRDRVDGDKKYFTMTTSERIDHVIRNVAFRDNYLGVQYLNAVVKGEDYSDVVKEKQRLMGLCLNTPGIRCGKSMTKEERRLGKNAYWAYDGLVDVNNGNGLEPKLKYGEFMQAFMLSFVASSALEAQEVKLFPLDDDVLKKHNGKALGYISEMSAFSNMGRVVHDRVGRSKESFNTFINSAEFKRVNSMILSRVSEREIVEVAEQLLNTSSASEQNILSDLVEWVNSLSYQELRLTEELIAKSVYISTFLGSEKQVLGSGDDKSFSNNSSFEILYIINKIVSEYRELKKSFGEEYSLKKAISPALNAVSFIYEKLSKEDSRKNYWYLLNIGYSALRETMYVRGALTQFMENIIKKQRSNSIYSLISNTYKYLLEVEKSGVSDLGDALRDTYKSSVGMDPFWDYVDGTTVRSYCSIEKDTCSDNKNYDEIKNLGFVLSKSSNLENTLNWLLIENKKTILDTANDFFPYLKVVK